MQLLSAVAGASGIHANNIFSSSATWSTIQTGFLVRGLFFLLIAGLLIAVLVLLLRRLRRTPKSDGGVEFSMVQQANAMNKKSAIVILVLVSLFVLLVSVFQLTMALLLQIDRSQGLPVQQTIVESVQSRKTLAGRIILFDESVFFDAAQVISESPNALAKYQISYLKHSHILTQFRELP